MQWRSDVLEISTSERLGFRLEASHGVDTLNGWSSLRQNRPVVALLLHQQGTWPGFDALFQGDSDQLIMW